MNLEKRVSRPAPTFQWTGPWRDNGLYNVPTGIDRDEPSDIGATPQTNSHQEPKWFQRSDATGTKLRQLISCIALSFPSNVLDRLDLASLDETVELEGLLA